MKKRLLVFFGASLIVASSFAQNISFPDARFKELLLKETLLNTDSDKNEISVQEAASFTGKLDYSMAGIKSFSGIEHFVKLTELRTSGNEISSIDVSKNIALTLFSCERCNLSQLDVSKNTNLRELYCSTNKLTSLDIRNNKLLTYFFCSTNLIENLDLTQNTELYSIGLFNNPFSTLDLSKNKKLVKIDINQNKLSTLDLCANTLLKEVNTSASLLLKTIKATKAQRVTFWNTDSWSVFDENCSVGIEDEFINETKTISKIYSIQGQEVNSNYAGLVILIYSDGSTKRIIQ